MKWIIGLAYTKQTEFLMIYNRTNQNNYDAKKSICFFFLWMIKSELSFE